MVAKGRPRDPGVEERVMKAVLKLLAENGYSGLRIDDVASASGVAKTTIYRRWPSLPKLVVDTIADSLGDREFVSTADPVSDLRRGIAMLVESVSFESNSLLAIALDIHRQADEELRTCYRKRIVDPPRQLLVETLARVKEAGRLRSTLAPEDLADMLIGAAIYRLAVLHDPLDMQQVEAIIAQLVVERPE